MTTYEEFTDSAERMSVKGASNLFHIDPEDYGWDDYNSGDPAKRLEERRSVYMSALGRMFDNYSFLTRSERIAGEANKAYRAAMNEVAIYPRPPKMS